MGKVHNRLAGEKSPYLLQHADNPVDWYSWGDEAFDKARGEDKPVFLSIGYSTCHWCHVMARESFEDPEVARRMNETFVSIKVDREERPDIDDVYMTVCQLMTGSGGWPLTIIMTPDKQPFFAGTYIPRQTRSGHIGMLELITKIDDLWRNRRADIYTASDRIMGELRRASTAQKPDQLDSIILDGAFSDLAGSFDRRHAGFGRAPKFPLPHNLMFLLRFWRRTGDDTALAMVETTLQAMRRGGIYDQIGYGFHRYSTDAAWFLPHFEKMLYDQALLSQAFTEAYQATSKPLYASTVREIMEYLLRDMRSPEGAFFSAQDAESEGEEGKFYMWTESEVRQLLDQEAAQVAIEAFGIMPQGNYRDEASGKQSGKNVLYLKRDPAGLATEMGIPQARIEEDLSRARQMLFSARKKRVPPGKDDKVLTDWNGLTIAALAKASQALGEPSFATPAREAAGFLLDRMRPAGGPLLHRFRGGEAAIPGNIDDYAFLIWGLTELYEATFDTVWLRAALDLADEMLADFWDNEDGGFYFTSNRAEQLIVRRKEIHDGAIPSGNSVAMLDLLRLAYMSGRTHYEDLAIKTAQSFAGRVKASPGAYCQLMIALDFAFGPSRTLVIAGKSQARTTWEMVDVARRAFTPSKVLLFRPTDEPSPDIVNLAEFTKDQADIGGKAAAHVCTDYECKLPTTSKEEMLSLLAA